MNEWRPPDPWSYSYLLGVYLGDGGLTVRPGQPRSPTRHRGRVAEYAYPRWFFSNLSADIRGLSCSTCDAVGVRWTRSNARNISVSHRRSVALLDERVGPKR